MRYRITHFIGNYKFIYETVNISDLYNAVCSVITNEHIMFPDRENAFNSYLEICSDLARGKITSHAQHVFCVERID